MVEAARDLGAAEYQVFRRIVLPMAAPGLIAGWLLSFTLSLDDVIVSFFTTGPTYEVLPLRIYSMVRLGIKPDVNAPQRVDDHHNRDRRPPVQAVAQGEIMKKTLLAMALVLLCSVPSFAGSGELYLYIWSEYIPDEVVENFTKETGITVNISTYDSNEAMYAKIKLAGEGYDLIVPSSDYVGLMRRQDMLLPLDKTKLTNFANLAPDFVDQPFDPDNTFSVPYMWGSTAIAVNHRHHRCRCGQFGQRPLETGTERQTAPAQRTPGSVYSGAQVLGILPQ